MDDPDGPIEHFEWGQFRILGKTHSEEGKGVGKDIFLMNGHVQAWSARKGHRLKASMVAVVFDRGISTLVIGNGVRGRVKVPARTQRAIHQMGIENLIIQLTPEACMTYNELYRSGAAVALLAHGTC
ncbi:MAG: hypothetical protein H0S79_10845 [Anaerolineaceae bacterium]|nr:hypothetical protein [Anaerolineaceae bacterium]